MSEPGAGEPDRLAVVHPRYGQASLSDVLPGVLAALGLPGSADPLGLATGALADVTRVAVLLVDGLGHHLLPLAAPHAPTLTDLAAARLPGASARAITAGFPTTTPTSLVSLGTGAVVGQHGVLGFTLNVPGTDRVLNHIDWWGDPDPYQWQPVPTQFERAVAAGVTATVVSRGEFDGSGLTRAAYRGGTYRGVADVDALAAEMLAALAEADGPGLVYGYHPDLDLAGHVYGVDSPAWRAAVIEVDRLLTRLIDGLPAGSALVVTADHGQLDVPAEQRIDIDADPRLRAGLRLVAGEPRVRYLHVHPGAEADVVEAWRGVLGDAAWTVTRAEAVAAGWFGAVPEEHLARVGDVVVACHDHYAVFASRSEPARVGQLVAFHGSATPVEMVIPLLVARG
ncbi:MAG: alkaline phosphatase family protein [Micromonosporaceae bacterium]